MGHNHTNGVGPGHSNNNNNHRRLNILLSNGRFPTSLDLARQLKRSGHHVYVVDPMHYHVCKFSNAVRKSYHVPAPHTDSTGYIRGVKEAIHDANIDLVIPVHEEILYLAESDEPEIQKRLFAPPFDVLLRLHSKWEFSRWLNRVGLDTPEAVLCRDMKDVERLDATKEWALKPVFGRASSKVYHLKPDTPLPTDCDVGEENHYIAQEWMYGERFCTYSVVRRGRMAALGIYPVKDTIDGSSCVYFQAIEHLPIQRYLERLVDNLPADMNGQLAFDFIETTGDKRLLAIECNPRSTSGLHLFSRTPDLGRVFTQPDPPQSLLVARPGVRKQVAPGMLMVPARAHTNLKEYLNHMYRLMTAKDVMFNGRDLGPSLMQPFLLTSYYQICREKGGMKLKDMFQWDLIWEPGREDMMRIRERLELTDRELEEKESGAC